MHFKRPVICLIFMGKWLGEFTILRGCRTVDFFSFFFCLHVRELV